MAAVTEAPVPVATKVTPLHEDVPSEITDSDLANAKRFSDHWRGRAHYTAERGWMFWDGKRWRPDPKELDVTLLAKATAESRFYDIAQAPQADRQRLFTWARKSQEANRITAMLYLARSEPGIPAKLSDFDADPWLLNCANGIVDLRHGLLRPHDSGAKLSRITNVAFDADAECALWGGFLWRVLGGSDELYAYIRRLCGYALTGLVAEQALYFLYGLGANGKSVFLETLAALGGEYHVALRCESLTARKSDSIPNDIARLAGARLVTVSETAEGSRLNEPLIKDLTGGDTITARFMRQEWFDFRPTLKLMIRGNHRPLITGTDDGIWRRLHLIPFAVQIPENEQDPDLTGRLREELPGILKWSLAGLKDWHECRLSPPDIVRQATSGYRSDMDIIGAYIEERCEVRNDAIVNASALYTDYRDWAGTEAVSSRRFGEAMTERRFGRQRAGGGKRQYIGLTLKSGYGTP